VSELAAGVPRRVEDAVMRSLARNPAYRPASAAELAHSLSPKEAEAPTVPLQRPRSKQRLWLALAAVVAVAAVLLAVALGTRGGSSPAPKPPPATARRVPHGATAQEQARNIGAWLRQNSR
jgi:hypothetical protein